MKVKVGVVGLGFMGSAHARVYSQLKECELVGICDSNPVKKYLAEEYRCGFFERYSDLLVKELDAISICTPTSTHKEIALEALENNRHILVEKPMTANVKDAGQIVKMVKKSGLLAVGYIERFNPALTKLREIVDLDDIYSTVSTRFGPGSPRIRDVGVLLDLGSGSSPQGLLINHDDYLGIDPSEAKIEYMKSKDLTNCVFVHGDMSTVVLQDKFFDTALFIEVIEHLHGIEEAEFILDKLYDTLKPNGKLIVATPNFGGFFGKTMDRLYGIFQKNAYADEHQLKFSLETLKELCIRCGFTFEDGKVLSGADMVCLFRKV